MSVSSFKRLVPDIDVEPKTEETAERLRRAQEKQAQVVGARRRERQLFSPLLEQEERARRGVAAEKRIRTRALRQTRESKRFYGELGYPEYAGKYKPFDVPEGYTVKKLEETPKGLTVSFDAPKGIAETIMEWRPPWKLSAKQEAILRSGRFEDYGDPIQFVAGVVASVEAPVYSLGGLAGFKTPRPPPTTTGGLLSYALGQPKPLRQAQEYGKAYGFGTIIGDVYISKGLGKIGQKIIEEPIQKLSQKWLTGKYLAETEKGILQWKGWPERFVMKVTGAKPYVAPQVVSVPSPHTVKSAFGAIQAWKLRGTKTSLLGIGGTTGVSKRVQSWVADKLVKGFITGGLSYATVQKELGKVKPSLPHLPKIEHVTPSVGKLPTVIGIVGPSILRSFTRSDLTARVRPVQRRKAKPIQIVRYDVKQMPSVIQKQKQRQTTVLRTRQVQAQKQTQKQQLQMPFRFEAVSQISVPSAIRDRFPRLAKGKHRGKDWMKQWYFKKHPLATTKKMKRFLSGR